MVKLILILVLIVGSAISRPSQDPTSSESKIELKLHEKLQAGHTVSVFVRFSTGTDEVIQAISDTRFPTRDDKLIALSKALEENAQTTQANLIAFISQFRGYAFESFWINNQILIRDADLSLVSAIAQFAEVISLYEEPIFTLDDPAPSEPILNGRPETTPEWGIRTIQAEEARTFLGNITTNAASIRVATIDTGVRYTHEALRDNFVGDYGWYDPYLKTPLPNDQNGHGTHTMGTIAGKGGIGVYPEAKWMSCKGCDTLKCTHSAVLSCGQFMVCPTLPDGTGKDCTKAPNLVSNSWGTVVRGYSFYDEVISAWHAGEIIPIFSIGNSGSSCDTASSPGDRDVIGVGSTAVDETISSFSSVGPSADGKMKPDVSAPGSDVISAYNTADNAYRSLSGTSMACPHTSGLIAILLAYKPDTTYDQIRLALYRGAETATLQPSGKVCYDLPDNIFPNYVFGRGRINALHSLQKLYDSRM